MSRATVLPSEHNPDNVAIMALDGDRLGTFERRGLWRDGVAIVGGVEVAIGTDALVLFLEAVSEEPPFVMLKLHDGYHAVYRDGGMPSSRILSAGERHVWRRFDPHASIAHPTFEDAVDRARFAHED
jgi:hypothetical protein